MAKVPNRKPSRNRAIMLETKSQPLEAVDFQTFRKDTPQGSHGITPTLPWSRTHAIHPTYLHKVELVYESPPHLQTKLRPSSILLRACLKLGGSPQMGWSPIGFPVSQAQKATHNPSWRPKPKPALNRRSADGLACGQEGLADARVLFASGHFRVAHDFTFASRKLGCRLVSFWFPFWDPQICETPIRFSLPLDFYRRRFTFWYLCLPRCTLRAASITATGSKKGRESFVEQHLASSCRNPKEGRSHASHAALEPRWKGSANEVGLEPRRHGWSFWRGPPSKKRVGFPGVPNGHPQQQHPNKKKRPGCWSQVKSGSTRSKGRMAGRARSHNSVFFWREPSNEWLSCRLPLKASEMRNLAKLPNFQ